MFVSRYALLVALALTGVVLVDETPQTDMLAVDDWPDVTYAAPCLPVEAPYIDNADSREPAGRLYESSTLARHEANSPDGGIDGQGLGPCILLT